MREQSQTHFCGLDIGTQTVRAVVGILDQNDESRISIIGHGQAPNLGMRKGVIVHVDDVVESVIQAITEAERLAGVQINKATVNVNGSHVTGMDSKGVVAISTANREISEQDRYRVEEAATIVKLPPNREIIQVFAKNYRLDGQDNIKDPVGMQGVRLEVDTHIVTATTPNVRNLESVLDKAKVQDTNRTFSGLAAAEAVMTRQQKESGSVLLDIGAGTTNMVIIEDGEVQHVSVIPVGGQNVTNDLAIGLKTELNIAEKVKLKYAALGKDIKDVKVTIDGDVHTFSGDDIKLVTEARIEELFELVDKELKRVNKSRKLPGGVILVGGTSKITGISEFAKDKLQLAARVGEMQPLGGLIDEINDPAYATAVGLMHLDMLLEPSNPHKGTPNKGAFRVIEGLTNLFKKG